MQPPDPCIRKEDGLLRFLAWQAAACVFLVLFFVYMVTINPFVYVIRYAMSWLRWYGHRDLKLATALSLIEAYSDRVSQGALLAFTEEQSEYSTYSFAIRPGYHHAKLIIVLKCNYDTITVTTSRG